MLGMIKISTCMVVFSLLCACGDEDGSEADRLGVGASCENNDVCAVDQACLTEFKGGYCGVQGCEDDTDCPAGSACVTDDGFSADGGLNSNNYCFLICDTKTDCNRNRSVEDESNCSSSIDFIDDTLNRKACIPPSGS